MLLIISFNFSFHESIEIRNVALRRLVQLMDNADSLSPGKSKVYGRLWLPTERMFRVVPDGVPLDDKVHVSILNRYRHNGIRFGTYVSSWSRWSSSNTLT